MELSIGAEVIPLFSSPVYCRNLGLYQQPEELKQLRELVTAEDFPWMKNHDNEVSRDNHWLESIKDTRLYNLITKEIESYFYGLLQADSDIKIRITESWLNRTAPGQQHHKHRHSNSIISGVYYFDVLPESGSLIFSKDAFQAIEYTTLNSNIYNSKHWILNPKNHTLFLFPSDLEHKVSKNMSNSNRISLSFNTFISGPISKAYLQSLEI